MLAVALTLLVALGLVTTAVGASTAAETSDEVPQPLETDYYTDLEIGSGETLTYHAEVGADDLLSAWAWSESVALDVRITGPDGTPVGVNFSDSIITGTGVVDAPTDGTYTVEVTNTDDRAATFNLNVVHETPIELGDGTYAGSIGPEEVDHYTIDLTEVDELSIDLDFEISDPVEFDLLNPELEQAEDIAQYAETGQIELSDVETEGTYVLEIYNSGDEPASYGFEVAHDGPGGTDAEDENDRIDSDEADVDVSDEDGADSDEDAAASDEETVDSEGDSADGDTADADNGDGSPGLGPMSALVALVAVAMIALTRARADANQ